MVQSIIAHPTVNAILARSVSSRTPPVGTPPVHINSILFSGDALPRGADPVIATVASRLGVVSFGAVIFSTDFFYRDGRGGSGLEGFGRPGHRKSSGGIAEEGDACDGAEDDGVGDHVAGCWYGVRMFLQSRKSRVEESILGEAISGSGGADGGGQARWWMSRCGVRACWNVI